MYKGKTGKKTGRREQAKKVTSGHIDEEDGAFSSHRGIQQDDNYREFMGWITEGGLRYAYCMYHDGCCEKLYQRKVDEDMKRHVIIVGAGMAGLSAAYELAQIGHEVTILELQSRVGGRVKTFREGFAEGLLCEGGAMRLPPNHYLTWHYLHLFEIKTVPFQNYNGKGYLYLYGDKIRMDDWKSDNKWYCDKYWPNWDKNLTEEDKEVHGIDGILSYFDATMQPVIKELGRCPSEEKWRKWLHKWSKLSTEDYLRGCCVDKNNYPLVPWPEAAIEGYKVSTYTPTLEKDLATHLREDLGTWWKDPLKTPESGMDTLPKAFTKKNKKGWNHDVDLSKKIKYGIMVTKVENFETIEKTKKVKITGENKATGHSNVFIGDAVILTPPLHILRQMDIPFSREQRQALAHISYQAATKIMLQCKTRFWQKYVGQGGFSKTDMMIGQLHYPDYNDSGKTDDERGVLVVYTWGENALTFGSQPDEMAIRSAVHEISKIHPEIKEEFEVGCVQAWYSDPSAQGAFAFLKPYEYNDHMKVLTTPSETIYLAGEALSWANGWIQGAIFSGLWQAYCFQSHVEDKRVVAPMSLLLK